MTSNPSRDRFRPVTQATTGNGAVPVAVDTHRAVASALAYASRGWPVFPCQPGTKEPATRHGFHDASTDPSQIRSWWERIPTANVAIATGAPGPDVLDVDHHGPAGNGFGALSRLRREGLLPAAGAIVRTPHAGVHVYFAGSDQASGRLPRHHLDFKAVGGYVLAPPSRVDGRPYYSLHEDAASGGIRWAAITRLLDPQPNRPARPAVAAIGDASKLAAWVERLEEGNRNAGLFWAACRVVESGRHSGLDEVAAAAAKTGLTEREIARTIDSARRGGVQRGSPQLDREAAR